MKRLLLALAMGVLLLLLVGVGTAAANPPAGQGSGQSAGSQQDAGAAAGTAQQGPTNSNSPIRVLSPGDAGSVEQSNEASSNATAGNVNGTQQTADQTQAGIPGLQAIGQSATNDQDALALALTHQEGASNENMPVRVLSDGEDDPVSQSNIASSDAVAGNVNATEQSADQTQAGNGAGSQIVGQSADNEQDATALSATVQENPSNTNIPVRVLSPGDDGSVTQSNEATSNATAANLNGTKQTADQSQGGGSIPCGCGGSSDRKLVEQVCGCPVADTQLVGQSADNAQEANAVSLTEQSGANNENISVRVLSPGDNGSVEQSNVASSNATAANVNATEQSADQTQAGTGAGSQIVGQSANNEQSATALSATKQENPSNSNISVRVLSPGDDGDVSQSNIASSNATAANSSNATAANLNGTKQTADQSQAGGSGIQVIGQESKSGQFALAGALTVQLGASNENAPVRVLSPGDGGSVSQSNNASSNALAGNINWTDQNAVQEQGGRQSSCCGVGIQAIGQSSQNWQGAQALAVTLQLGLKPPCRCQPDSQIGNSNAPTRVLSPGDDGSVRQSNVATSNAIAANSNATRQVADQLQDRPDSCRCKPGTGIQAIGQLDDNSQFAAAFAASLQLGAANEWAPDRKSSPGSWGGLTQSGKNAAHDASGSQSTTDRSKSQGRR